MYFKTAAQRKNPGRQIIFKIFADYYTIKIILFHKKICALKNDVYFRSI